MIKLHARVTKEIEISEEQAERLKMFLKDEITRFEIKDILDKFISSTEYDNGGYIPQEWLQDDLGLSNKFIKTIPYEKRVDIEL